MLVKMTDDKRPGAEPAIVFTTSQVPDEPKKSRVSKKAALIAVISLVITGLVVTAVLVGIRLVTDSNVEMLKYSMKANGVNQSVTTDSNNVVTYHVTKGTVEAWIVQDFDKDIQATKVISDGVAACYVTALNRSTSPDAAAIPSVEPTGANNAPTQSVTYKVSPQQIPDLTYLGSKISSMCQNVPTYHATPDCGISTTDKSAIIANNGSSSVDHRSKRTPAFCATCTASRTCLCACGCCSVICGEFASSQYILTYRNGVWYCTYYMYTYYLYGSLPGCSFKGRYYNP